jgi:hypothetical protein
VTGSFGSELTARQLRRRLLLVALRVLVTSGVLVAAYYAVPLDRLGGVPVSVSLAVGLLILGGVSGWQVKAVTGAANPAIRAIEALAATIPLLLILFASSYFLVAQADPASFNDQALDRTDLLYFTVTVFSSTGFGDIVATSQPAIVLVTFQMALDLVVLGLGLRVFTRAIHIGQARNQRGNLTERTVPGRRPEPGDHRSQS